MKRKHKSYSRPKRPFDKARIEEEAKIKKEFGLKNKKEIWKAEAKVKVIRGKAKKLIAASKDAQEKFFEGLKKIGLNVNSIAEVLSLGKKDYLDRRLQTIVVKKKLTTTPKSARQLIVHKKILVDGNVVNIPSYIVPIKFEDKITKKESKKAKKKANAEEIKSEEENAQE